MLKLLITLILLTTLVGGGWYFGRDYAPKNVRQSDFAMMADAVVDTAWNAAARKLGLKDLLVKPEEIFQFNGSDLGVLIDRTLVNNQGVFLYLYDFECVLCHLHLQDINKLALAKKGSLPVMAVAITGSREILAEQLTRNLLKLHFTPIMVQPSEKNTLISMLRKHDIAYSKQPLLVLMGQSGFSKVMPPAKSDFFSITREIDQVF